MRKLLDHKEDSAEVRSIKRWLIDGHLIPEEEGGIGGWLHFLDDLPDFRDVWAEIRDEAVARYIKQRPGTRPKGWWLYDAPELRRKLEGAGEVVGPDGEAGYGVPDVILFRERVIDGEEYRFRCNAGVCKIESEAAYLRRLKLLTPAERKRLTAKDYKPVEMEFLAEDELLFRDMTGEKDDADK